MRHVWGFAFAIVVLTCSLPALADCPSDCVESCSAGLAEDYVICLNACIAGCDLPDVPAPPPPTPVPTPATDSDVGAD